MTTAPVDKCPRCESAQPVAAFRSTTSSYYYCSDCGYMWDVEVTSDDAAHDGWPDALRGRAHDHA